MSILLVAFFLFVYINSFFELTDVLRYWDELLVLYALFFFFFKIIRLKKIKIEFDIFLYTFFLIIIGLLGNLFFRNQSSFDAIVRDIVGFIKFPIIFMFFYNIISIKDVNKTIVKILFPCLKLLVFIITLLGLVSLFCDIGLSHMSGLRGGIYPYKFLASHPTSLVLSLVLIFCTFISYENKKNRRTFFYYYLLISISIILTMRTKGFAILAVIWYVKYFSYIIRSLFFQVIAFSVVLLLATFSKLYLYSTFGGSGRFDLYINSFILCSLYFPFGAGFGSYASHISGLYKSDVYNLVSISEIFDKFGNPTSIIGDTGYPYYLGQFGVCGIIVCSILFVRIFNYCSFKRLLNYGPFFIFAYILIGLTTESTLLNYGAELGSCLALCIKIIESKNKFVSNEDKNVRPD